MSDAGGPQSPPPPKAKPAASSAFIDKGGKKFAPKVKARRRPGAGAAAAPAKEQQQPTQTPAPAPASEQPAAAQLPTPAATQDVSPQEAPQTAQPDHALPAVAPSIAAPKPTITTREPSPATPAVQREEGATIEPAATPQRSATPRQGGDELGETQTSLDKAQAAQADSTTAGAVQTVHPPVEPVPTVEPPHSTTSDPIPTDNTPTAPPHAPAEAITETTPQSTAEETHAPVIPTQNVTEDVAAINDQNASGQDKVPAAPPRSEQQQQQQPWAAVNEQQGDEPAPATSAPKRKGRKRQGPVTLRNIDEEEGGYAQEEDVAPRRPSAKALGKRKARRGVDGEAVQPAKKTRKPRANKGKGKAVEGGEENGNAAETEPVRPSKRKRPAKKSAEQVVGQGETQGDGEGEAQGDGEEGEQQSKRRGRAPRPETPSDAENEVIDETDVLMHNIASRNIRTGRLSERERKMREVDWDDIKAKRKASEALNVDHRRQQEELLEQRRKEQEEAEASRATQHQGTTYVLGADGRMVMRESARVIDQAAEAERERDNYTTVVEDDVTKQINNKSFMRNGKRHPQEFMLPGQGRRWNAENTDKFWKGLKRFGTDFAAIKTMFPEFTRRSIKLKYDREQRDFPERMTEVLNGPRDTDWNEYLDETGRQGETFTTVKEFKAQLDEEAREMQEQINAALEAAAEERRQRRIAGLESDEEPANAAAEQGKKKRGRKEKTVTFAQEEGVEVLGEVDEVDGWGQE
ncbi:hypothetical protein P280DRAFT_471844 [Massarina eburnea CBS 473.64]|uniref:Transcription factor TFIIIB component B'' Myb domain-containing protein n=1 Tax=Massarina eburnea CBS 473.64 TaxID=1395130 RepID=A0A6A6RQJ8_9PLEO|nr:hypothetical protein P280DRAFT_471844 [Massarina eburnea CBS 473.64]